MDVYNQFILSKFNQNILTQLMTAAAFKDGLAQPPADSISSANYIDAIAEKSKTATMPEAPNANCEQMNQQKNDNHLTNSILHEINRQFLSALLHKGVPKSTTDQNKQNDNLNPLTPPQTPITIASTVATSKSANASFGGNPHAIDATDNDSHRKRKRPPTANDIDADDDDIESPPMLTMLSQKSDLLKRRNKTGSNYCADSIKKRRRNDDISSTDETDPDPENDSDANGDGDRDGVGGEGNGDDRFDRSDISSDTEHDDKSNCSDGHDSSNLSKICAGFGENETSFDSVSTIPAGNSLLFNNSGGSGSKAATGTGLNLVADKDKLNLLKLISLQGDENKLIGKYLSKYSSFMECNNEQCCIDKLREHFHCLDILCLGVNKVLCKREEVLRHLKWHKKRNESLTHGFLRFSSSDDCSIQFNVKCPHNGKQTHYHCLQGKCDKIYISTSDVQMHSNYHRKDTAIMQEGFQRFRATEECSADYCTFAGQRTTHFHCIRDSCNYTFKNKAEMEKHKTYHIKDEQLARDGFKKFLKNEPCTFDKCRFSQQCNHIHCVRENCFYVLHSSGQLLSHKRKHERMDSERTYQQFKLSQKAMGIGGAGEAPAEIASTSSAVNFPVAALTSYLSDKSLLTPESLEILQQIHFQNQSMLKATDSSGAEDEHSVDNGIETAIPKNLIENSLYSAGVNAGVGVGVGVGVSGGGGGGVADDECLKQIYKNKQLNAALLFAKNNFNSADHQSEPLNLNLRAKEVTATPPNIVMRTPGVVSHSGKASSNLQQITSIEGLFNRKRGRPPKNRVVEVYQNVQSHSSPQAIFTSFKLEKNGNGPSSAGVGIDAPSESNDLRKLNDSASPRQRHHFALNRSHNTSDTSDSPIESRSEASANERKRKLSFSSTQSNETDKVSVVRAAGTFFPQNCNDEPPLALKKDDAKCVDAAKRKCSIDSCNVDSANNHLHCDVCNEIFSDESKLQAHAVVHSFQREDESSLLNSKPADTSNHLLLQHFSKLMAEQARIPFSMESILGATTAMPAPMMNVGNSDTYPTFGDQLSAQIQVMCLAQMATAAYQQNPLLAQTLYPLLSAAGSGVTMVDPFKQTELFGLPAPTFDLLASTSPQANKKMRQGRKSSNVSSVKASDANRVAGNGNTGFKAFKDEPIPLGYLKFRFNEDCNFANCGYSNLQSHFHCCRADCYYSFCDKTRFVQHTARHERLDKLMGDDFKQYRANMQCGYDHCVYKNNLGANNKSSHFHCLKCDFICSDTNKVVAHRRQHSKMEYIRTVGFRKVANNERCMISGAKQSNDSASNSGQPDDDDKTDGENSTEHRDSESRESGHEINDSNSIECSYSMKQTHYHCLVCDCSVLSRAQLSSHRHK